VVVVPQLRIVSTSCFLKLKSSQFRIAHSKRTLIENGSLSVVIYGLLTLGSLREGREK
jgi:hypothetical protein